MDPDTVLGELAAARRGHFLLESGHHGPLWLDLDALFRRPAVVAPLLDALAERVGAHAVDVVCGPLTGGALVGYGMAERLGVDFAHAERTAHRPGELYSAQYRIPSALHAALAGKRVAVVDDVVNAGSATRSTVAAVRAAGGIPVLVGALLRLGAAVATYAAGEGMAMVELARWDSPLWEPATCPRCAAGERLVDAADR